MPEEPEEPEEVPEVPPEQPKRGRGRPRKDLSAPPKPKKQAVVPDARATREGATREGATGKHRSHARKWITSCTCLSSGRSRSSAGRASSIG